MEFEELSSTNQEADQDEVLSPAEVINMLKNAWLNEKFSPEILPHNKDVVDCVLDQINSMQKKIESSSRTLYELKLSLHRMEIDRIRYMLSSYLRSRLQKIECMAPYILSNDHLVSRLTAQELNFAQEFKQSVDEHFTTVVLKNMPRNIQQLDPNLNVPNLNSFVFMKVEKDVSSLQLEAGDDPENEEAVDLAAGDQHIIAYKFIKDVLVSGHVSLF